MTLAEQNIAIAKICTGIDWVMLECWCIRQDGKLVAKPKGPLPYTTSLDAMHEAEKTLNEEQYRLFIEHLVAILKPGEFSVRAKSSQRAEVFLRVHNAWK